MDNNRNSEAKPLEQETSAQTKKYEVTDALAPLAVHKLVNVMAATINNNTVTLNVQETLPILLHTVDTEEFAKYDSVTPAELGCLASCEDAVEPMTF